MNYSDLPNEELLARYQNLDKRAFDEFFRRNSPILLSFVASRLKNHSEAEEVLQEAFFRIHKYILKFDREQNAMSWSFAIAKNCLLDHIAKNNRQREIAEESLRQQSLSEEEARFQQVAQDQLEHMLHSLPEDDRKLLTQRFLQEISYEDLAADHNISPAGARQRISRIVKKLRDTL